MAQVILNKKASTQASPTIYYSVEVTPTNRTANSVTLSVKVTSDLQYDSSNKGEGYTMTGGLYINGTWQSIVLKKSNETWTGSKDPYYKTATITVDGLDVTQTAITGVKFRVVSSNTSYNGGTLTATSCSDIQIERYGGVGYVRTADGWKQGIPYVKVNGVWEQAIPNANNAGNWKVGV